jgi:HEAT repeat protein
MLKDNHIANWVRGNIAGALGPLGERSVASYLIEMLKERRMAEGIRSNIVWALGELGEQSVVADLVEMLKDDHIGLTVPSGGVAKALSKLARDEQTMETCVWLLSHTRDDVADAIYSALWDMSRRAEVTIVVRDEDGGEGVEFVPWQGGMRR